MEVSIEGDVPLSEQVYELFMPYEENGGIIRWRDLSATVDAIRREVKQETQKLEAGQDRNTEEITKLRAEVASLKTELRIFGGILLALLLSIIGIFLNHIAP